MFDSSEAVKLRAFLKDKLGFQATDIGDGWLIFNFSEGKMGVHPTDNSGEHGASSGAHDISFYCDNIEETVQELKSRGVEFKKAIEDHGYGFVT